MTDEIRIYRSDDPNDAPDRRLGAFPTINPFLPTSLPTSLHQYVIEPVASELYKAMHYWFQQGIAVQRHHQQQQQQHQHLQQLQQLQQNHSQTQPEQHLQYLQHLHIGAQPNQQTTEQHITTLTTAPVPVAAPASTPATGEDAVVAAAAAAASARIHDHQPASAASTARMASSSASSSASTSSSSTSSASPAGSSSSSTHSGEPPSNVHSHQQIHHNSRSHSVSSVEQEQPARKHEHIKKPLNPFMIFMQKQRPEIVKEGKIKESAAINQLLGQQWRKLSREEQEPYYKLAEQEKILHAQKYPGWSARDNYANQKKRKKLKLKSISLNGLDQSDKKCRARFGLSNMPSWCKPCKRKKKCIYSTPRQDRHHQSNNHTHHNNHHHPLHHNNHHHHHHHHPFHPHAAANHHSLSFQF